MDISGKTSVIGIIGCPVEHSLSPVMHNAIINELGMDMVYVPFMVKPLKLKEAVASIRALNISGVNVTIPHKEAVIDYLDDTSEEVARTGAVNTVVNHNGVLKGFNTDGEGYIRSLKNEFPLSLKGKRITIIGAGGASKGIATALAKEGCSMIAILNRTIERASLLSTALSTCFPGIESVAVKLGSDSVSEYLCETDILINTTPTEMNGEDSLDIPLDLLSNNVIVSDIVYRPRMTPFLKKAEKKGYAIHGGLGMLVNQGALSFKLWTEIDPPMEIMFRSIENALKKW